jgi:hypothetical protein
LARDGLVEKKLRRDQNMTKVTMKCTVVRQIPKVLRNLLLQSSGIRKIEVTGLLETLGLKRAHDVTCRNTVTLRANRCSIAQTVVSSYGMLIAITTTVRH